MAYLGVDTGGTFTDFLLLDDAGQLRLHKVLSTPHAPEEAIVRGIRELGLDPEALHITHGSTVATNAILEGKGVRTAYVCNRGLADVLTIGRQARRELYQLQPAPVLPLVPTELCLEVDSRLSAEAQALQRLDDEDLARLLERLQQLAPAAVSINLLFSFLDDDEELRIEQAIAERFAGELFISRSSDVLPVYREYERGVTTTLNAMVGPLMQQYLQRLSAACAGAGIEIMQSSAGTTSVEHAGRYPVHLLLSGPAGGLLGARRVCQQQSLLTFDMGGTSTDVSIIRSNIAYTHDASIAGYPVGVPMVDMHTIGAGGGSIANVDDGGLLQVGPASAGADPGPACYGKGGQAATVTDANVVLGRLLPEAFLGGGMTLDAQASLDAVQAVAERLGISALEAAQGIIDVVDDHMVRALRVMSVQRGEDPADYTLVSFGGAGGLHVCALAEALQMTHAVVPVHAGVLSALGMLAAEQVRERSKSINRLLQECSTDSLQQVIDELATLCTDELSAAGFDEDVTRECSVDLRYSGQSHALTVPWREDSDLAALFHDRHEASYGHRLDIDIELVNIRVRMIARAVSELALPQWCATEAAQCTMTEMPGSAVAVSVRNRTGLEQGERLIGPMLITESASTTWLAPGWQAEVDCYGNLLLSTTADT